MDTSSPRTTERVAVWEWHEETDVEIAPLIRSMWEAGIETVMSGQDTGDGWVWIQFATLEGLEEFVTTIVQMASESSSIVSRISWEGDYDESSWSYEIYPSPYRPDETLEGVTMSGKIERLFLETSVRFQKLDLQEVTELMALFNAGKDVAALTERHRF